MATTYKVNKQNYTPSTGEINKGKTKTIPNEAYSVREMLIKHANGTLYDNVKTPFYEEQATFSTKPLNVIQSMDLPEKLIYLQQVQSEANQLKNNITTYLTEQETEKQEKQQRLADEQARANAQASAQP